MSNDHKFKPHLCVCVCVPYTTGLGDFSTSTRHVQKFPTMERRMWQQNRGISTLPTSQACKTIIPFGIFTREHLDRFVWVGDFDSGPGDWGLWWWKRIRGGLGLGLGRGGLCGWDYGSEEMKGSRVLGEFWSCGSDEPWGEHINIPNPILCFVLILFLFF